MLPACAVTTVVMVVVPLALSAILPDEAPEVKDTPFTVIVAPGSTVTAFCVTDETDGSTEVI